MKPTWKNTLRTDESGKSMNVMAEFCFSLGYDYMLWNDRIYKVFFEHPRVIWADTNMTIADIPDITIKETVVVAACSDSNGSPVMLVYKVEVTEEQYDLGEHYDMATAMADNEGYEGPFVCFDESEQSEIIEMGKLLTSPHIDNLD